MGNGLTDRNSCVSRPPRLAESMRSPIFVLLLLTRDSQVILFGMLAVLVKLRAPTSHTFLEIIQARWGRVAHTVFLVFALTTSVIVTSMLQLGGAAVVNALTGVNLNLASALIPVGVILYTLAGGLRATFVASYFNTAVIMLFLVTFSFIVFTRHGHIGSPDRMWELLQKAGETVPVKNNLEGSYLTFWVSCAGWG